jgi:hypothetical protein
MSVQNLKSTILKELMLVGREKGTLAWPVRDVIAVKQCETEWQKKL